MHRPRAPAPSPAAAASAATQLHRHCSHALPPAQVGGCVNIDSLVSGAQYKFTVQSWSTIWNSGESASIIGRAG